MRISRHLDAETIVMDLHGATQEELLQELSERISNCVPSLKPQQLGEDLINREKLLSTATGFGLAFPHCYEKVDKPYFALGIHRIGIDADAPDRKPVHILLVVISPENKPETHLEALSSASKVFMIESVRDQILKAGSAEEILEIIKAAEEEEE